MMIRPLAAAAALLCLTTAAPAAEARSSDYIYCVVQDASHHQAYYSAVFPGDYGDTQTYQQAFYAHVDARWGGLSSGAVALCFYAADANAALDEENGKAANDRRDGLNVTFTRWSR